MVIKKPNSNTIVPHFSGRPSTMSQSTVLPSAPVSGLAPAATPIAPRPLKRIVVIPRQPTKITNIASVQPMKRTAPVAPTVVPMKKKLIVTPPVVATPPKADISTVESLLNKDAEKKPNTVRKRQNLSNMSAQQRQERRMLMNRTAAQNARDRKKRHNERLEVAVRELLNETRYLRSRVVELENRLNNANQLISQNGLSTSQSAPNATSVQQSLDPIGFAEIIHGPQRRERESKVQWTSATWALVNESTRRLEVQDLANSAENGRSVFDDLIEAADGLDLDKLCQELLDDGFSESCFDEAANSFSSQTNVCQTSELKQPLMQDAIYPSDYSLHYNASQTQPDFAYQEYAEPDSSFCYDTVASSNDPLLEPSYDFDGSFDLMDYSEPWSTNL